ncbi:cell death in tomato 1 [Lindgomyces ingoldianus]|uniref:Cell death in tomato 1 n=1 Tax=Lindgomyces ingoldianus TaxID=673940 RepID=A0ACB6QA95_9PLEO|nr:cell death in tomato 1 [Lindgomyces ingoldianus]KAF2463800.1 cell death in tomato 1 [Lindgomyces ingoldianus]
MVANAFAIVVLIAATTVSAAPTIKIARDDLQPWELQRLYTHSPSGRPGNDPHSTLNVTIHDPNTIYVADTPTGAAEFPPSTANCSAQWLTQDDVPWGIEQPCTDIDYGYWTMTMVEGSGEGATEDFGLEFKLVDKVTVLNTVYTRIFTGSGTFKVGDNLSGQCGGSGQCNWALTETPYLMTQAEQSS